ncbi:hypothetical protein WJX74_000001 [Apatococcus lobatus]|uniref:KOW domain-containing protein n=1 Tax=Apatococcus lobatus TaxID=904363 RepID=A0AAW1RGD3_9CHLO
MGIPKKTIRPMFKKDKWKILRGDTVMITAGKDKGRTGTVSRVIRDSRKPLVIVEGLNLRKRFNKATQEQQGSMISVEGPVAYSSVQLIDPSTKLPIRVTWRYTQDGDKVRETRGQHATNSIIPRPDILAERRKPAPLPGARDTGLTEALRHTFAPGDRPGFLQPQQQYSSAAWSMISGSIHTRRRLPLPVLSFKHGFAADALLQR